MYEISQKTRSRTKNFTYNKIEVFTDKIKIFYDECRCHRGTTGLMVPYFFRLWYESNTLHTDKLSRSGMEEIYRGLGEGMYQGSITLSLLNWG